MAPLRPSYFCSTRASATLSGSATLTDEGLLIATCGSDRPSGVIVLDGAASQREDPRGSAPRGSSTSCVLLGVLVQRLGDVVPGAAAVPVRREVVRLVRRGRDVRQADLIPVIVDRIEELRHVLAADAAGVALN